MHWEWGFQRGHPGRSCAWTPEKAGYIYSHSKHLCFCKGDKRESASLPGGMIHGFPRHWVWAALEGMMQCLMDEGWGQSLGHTLIKRIKLPWLVEWDANPFSMWTSKAEKVWRELTCFTSLPWSHLSKLEPLFCCPDPMQAKTGGAHPILQPPMIPHPHLAILNWEWEGVF